MPRPWRPVRLREIAFGLAGLPLAIIAAAYVFVILYVGVVLVIVGVGLPLATAGLRGARKIGGLHRLLVGVLLNERIEVPAAVPRARSVGDWIRKGLTDPVGWRTILYLIVRLPMSLVTFFAVAGLPLWGVWGVGFPLWDRLLEPHASAPTWWYVVAVVPGVLALMAFPVAVDAMSGLNRWLARTLLSPFPRHERLHKLQRASRVLSTGSTSDLRRIERDLHDSTQAELVAIAITLSLAADMLPAVAGPGADRLTGLIARARTQTDDAIAGLRRITRGINPPALEAGLDAALPGLTAACPVRATLTIRLKQRPGPVVERTVYFCVAELLTNIVKHSGAGSCAIDVHAAKGRLRVMVSDDGQGGARVGEDGGLAGLEARVAAVAGTLDVRSPAGGPTTIGIDLPLVS